MEENLKRARELLPAIVITVLSMIQALALELYWNRFQEADYLWQGGWDSWVGWLQFALLLGGIVEVWLLYVSLMLRFSWIPSMADTTVPFLLGLLEFALIDLIGPATIGPWFVALGLLFALGFATTRLSLIKARRDPANHWFFSHFPPAEPRDLLAEGLISAALIALGILLWLVGGRLLALGSLLFASVVLIQQLRVTRRFWLPKLGPPPEQE